MSNPETRMTLDDAVAEVLNLLTGMDLQYDPQLDRYNAITRTLNRSLRSIALEHEWSWYADYTSVGTSSEGDTGFTLPNTMRPRITGDDAVRFVDDQGRTLKWAYFLPRDAVEKHQARVGLWAAVTRQDIMFSRPLDSSEANLDVRIPVMREPTMFRLPAQPEDPDDPLVEVPDAIREQEIDFQYPDLVVLRAAYFYAQTDPVMQPRVQTLEAQYKDLMYQIIERDDRNTDSPFMNGFLLPVQPDIHPQGSVHLSRHPHSDERR